MYEYYLIATIRKCNNKLFTNSAILL